MKEHELEERILQFPRVRPALEKLPRNEIKTLPALVFIAKTLKRSQAVPPPIFNVSPSRMSIKKLRAVRRRSLDLVKEIELLEKAHIPPGHLPLLGEAAGKLSCAEPRMWEGFSNQLRRYACFLYQEIQLRSPRRFPVPALDEVLVCEFFVANEDPDPRSLKERDIGGGFPNSPRFSTLRLPLVAAKKVSRTPH